jgi:hypothetical protein
MNRILAHKSALTIFLVVMGFIMSYTIYNGISWEKINYFQIGIPFWAFCTIAFLFHKHHISSDKRILEGSIVGSFWVGIGCILWVILGCIALNHQEFLGVWMMSVALLWALSWVLFFALVGIFEDIIWAILVLVLWSDLWLNLWNSFWATLWHDLGFNINTITTVDALNIAIGVTLAGIIIHFYLSYKRICIVEKICQQEQKIDNL